MESEIEKINLFSCPIYKIRIDPNSYDKEKIINDILYNKNLSNVRNEPGKTLDNCDIHQSYRDQDNKDFRSINYDKLVAVYQKIFKEFLYSEIGTTKAFKWTFAIINYSAITEGQWLPLHAHLPQDFATIHYLNFKDDHNPTRFYNPATFATFLKWIQPELYDVLNFSQSDNSYIYEHSWISTKEDDLFIFPAAVNHETVLQGPTKEPRITVSTNINIENYEKSNN